VDPASITLNGTPLDPTSNYRVTVNNFMAAGGDGFTVLTEGKAPLTGAIDLDALDAYTRAHNPLPTPAMGRITRVP
jgi:5'-nucleotidase